MDYLGETFHPLHSKSRAARVLWISIKQKERSDRGISCVHRFGDCDPNCIVRYEMARRRVPASGAAPAENDHDQESQNEQSPGKGKKGSKKSPSKQRDRMKEAEVSEATAVDEMMEEDEDEQAPCGTQKQSRASGEKSPPRAPTPPTPPPAKVKNEVIQCLFQYVDIFRDVFVFSG